MPTPKIEAYSLNAVDVHESMLNSGLVFMPTFEHPYFPLAVIFHQIRGGAFYHTADALHPVGRHFGDGFVWEHMANITSFYKFPVKHAQVQARIGARVSHNHTLRALFGLEAAFRYVLAEFDESFSDVEVKFDSQGSATLVVTDGAAKGYDSWVPGYDRFVGYALESAVDESKAAKWMQLSASMPEESFVRRATEGFMRLTYEMPARAAAHHTSRGGTGEALPELRGSVADEYMRRSSAMYQTDDQAGGAYVRPGRRLYDGAAYATEAQQVYGEPIAQIPVYPLDGYNLSQLSGLAPSQRYGYVRAATGPHTGLDLPASTGTKIRALYDGVVKFVQPKPEGSGGIFVVLEHKFLVGGQHYKATSEYYHMSEAGALEPGDEVKQGDEIGLVGSTGNSTGPHLHLTIRVSQLDSMGRSAVKKVIDPEQVLRRGLVAAAESEGFAFGSVAKPLLSPAVATLSGIVGGRTYNPAIGGPDYQRWLAKTAEIFSRGAEAVSSAANAATRAAAPVARKGFDAFGPGSTGRAVLSAGYESVGLPGDLAGTVLDALRQGYESAVAGEDPKAVLTATLQGLESQGVQRAALDMAARVVIPEITKAASE